jgi:hypothetical protein
MSKEREFAQRFAAELFGDGQAGRPFGHLRSEVDAFIQATRETLRVFQVAATDAAESFASALFRRELEYGTEPGFLRPDVDAFIQATQDTARALYQLATAHAATTPKFGPWSDIGQHPTTPGLYACQQLQVDEDGKIAYVIGTHIGKLSQYDNGPEVFWELEITKGTPVGKIPDGTWRFARLEMGGPQ